MGKGGEKATNKLSDRSSVISTSSSSHKKREIKLAPLSTEELRKWATAYGVAQKSEEADREKLIQLLIPFADGIVDYNRPSNLPLEPPKFTLKDIKDAIPAHCFERNLLTSLSHLLSDLVIIAIFGYLASWIGNVTFLPSWSPYLLWPIYWYAQGAVFTGVWVLAHECGHQSFSASEFANNVVGTICHSLLLVPYHSWRITHGLHHNNTGSCENDEVFAPSTRIDWAKEMLRETPLAQAWGIIIMLTVGWMPGYLIFNATGPEKYRGKNANHFSPTAAFFKSEEYWLIVQSDIAFFAALAFLAFAIGTFDVYMPHFRAKEWNWLRGATCTVDRSFGPILDHTFHHITDTHVCHHLFSKMPFYHAQEATEAIKKVLGPYYLKDDTPIAVALWRSYSCCQFVENDGDIVFYKNVK